MHSDIDKLVAGTELEQVLPVNGGKLILNRIPAINQAESCSFAGCYDLAVYVAILVPINSYHDPVTAHYCVDCVEELFHLAETKAPVEAETVH